MEVAGLGRGPASGFIVRGAMAPVRCAGEIGRLLPARYVPDVGAIASGPPGESSGRGWLKPATAAGQVEWRF